MRVPTQDVQVKPEPENAADQQSSLIYATISPETAANVVNSGNFVGTATSLLQKNNSVPLLDAVVLSSDEHYVRIIETSAVLESFVRIEFEKPTASQHFP